MALTIDATPGGANANSYATEAEAAAYFEADVVFGPVWALLSAEEKRKRLVFATRTLERLDFLGDPETDTQALAFPRTTQDTPGEIPERVKAALFETVIFQQREAVPASSSSETVSSETVSGPVKRFAISGAISIEFGSETTVAGKETALGGNWEAVMELLAPYLGGGSNSFRWLK